MLAAFVIGCTSEPTARPAAADESAVREKFADIQVAIKNHDADKLWGMLCDKSRTDAERIVKEALATYAKASPKEKADLEYALGLTPDEVTKLTAIGLLKTKRFRKKYDEMPASKIEKVLVQGDSATVYFLEPDGDKEKLIFLRQDQVWKAWLAMPKVNQPVKASSPPTAEENAVRQKFAELQSAITSGDPEKLWAILESKSRNDVEQETKRIQSAYTKANAKEKSEMEDALGLSASEFVNLTSVAFLKTKRVQRKYHELPASKIENVVVQGDNATVHYVEPDDDKRSLSLVRQDGAWKVSLALPKVSLP